MSQEKVNRYKEEKANRKEILAKEKRKQALTKVCAGVIALALAMHAWKKAPGGKKENKKANA